MIIPMELPSLDVRSRPRTLRIPLPACLTDCLSPLVCAILEARGGSGAAAASLSAPLRACVEGGQTSP